jgi:aspartyl-tRNA(Asn)/glutamyl-tRNA(Gln) amidotransferase subunit A
MKNNLSKMTITEISELLTAGELSSLDICSFYLERVKELEPKLQAFLKVDEKEILRQASASDKRRSEGKQLSRFDGLPISLKDIINSKDEQCTCGSKILEPYNSIYDATVTERLRNKGFVLFGRNNMDEFAMGSSCENSAYFLTKNPWDISRVPGGSSGGSAAAVSVGEVPASLGTDTGGSVRQPAALCGVVGLKPTYGRVSRFGVVAYASSLDQVGPITRNVKDSALLLDIISGLDPKDSTTLPDSKISFEEIVNKAGDDLKGERIGLPKEYFELDGLDDQVKNSIEKTIEKLKFLGAEMVDISLPHTKYAIAAYYVIATAEASANLARFDGIRYGKRTEEYENLNELYFKSRGEGFGEEVTRRILLGTFVLSSGYYDAYYLKAQKVRTLLRKDFDDAFKKCDVIFSPVSPTTAFKIGGITDPVQMYLADIYTISVNMAGICAISVPSDILENSGLPVGVQFLGPVFGEDKILKVAKVFEENREIKEFIPKI